MKSILLTLVLGTLMACPALAQRSDSTNAPPPGGPPEGHRHGMDFLTDAEKTELKKAHDAAIAADPSLATEEQSMKEKMEAVRDSGNPPSEEDKAAFKAFHEKMDAAMLKADPGVAPILAKIKAHHRGGPGGPGGPPPPPPAGA
jgi:hypothetical protein